MVFAAVQTLDGLLITPYMVGERVGLGPVGVLIALMIGGSLFGFVGVLLAVPTAAALVVVIRRGIDAYKASHFYWREAEEPPAPPPAGPSDDSGPGEGRAGVADHEDGAAVGGAAPREENSVR